MKPVKRIHSVLLLGTNTLLLCKSSKIEVNSLFWNVKRSESVVFSSNELEDFYHYRKLVHKIPRLISTLEK